MMNERKLNINAPLMSVRRSCGTSPSKSKPKRKTLEKQQAISHYQSDKTLDQVTEPVTVPFNWEHIPGRSKGNDGSKLQPPNEIVSKVDCDKEQKDEEIKSVEENDDDDADVYSDALETLSSTESFSMKCSESDVSGLDNLDANKARTSSTDKQAQEFMMSRFLTAAKAMTLEPPQNTSRKKSVLIEQPRDFTKLVRKEKESFVNRHITDIIPYTGQYQEEEEESENETDGYANISAKGCGLFPRSCIRSSLCLLNQVPGTQMENQFPMFSSYEVGKSRDDSHIRSSRPAPAIRKAWDAIHKSKSSSGAASPDIPSISSFRSNESKKYTYSGELKQLGRISSFRYSRTVAASGTSSFRSKPQSSSNSSTQQLPSQGAQKSSNSGSLTLEKACDIDTKSTVTLSSSKSSFVDDTKRINTMERKVKNSTVDSFQDMKYLEALEKKLDSEVLSNVDANSLNLSSMLHLMAKEDEAERLKTDQEINRDHMSLQLVQSSFNKDAEINNQQIVVVNDSAKDDSICVLHPLPPPLPKSPSESWLSRALPLVSLKNSLAYSNQSTPFHDKRQGFRRASSFAKWETIVKTSNLHHDHAHSQELIIYKSQHSKS